MPSSSPRSPDADLHATLDLLGRVVADISDRVDKQTEEIQRLARAQPSPEAVAATTEAAIRRRLEPAMHKLLDTVSELTGDPAKLRLRLRALRAERWLKGQSWWQTGQGRALLLGAALMVMLALAVALARPLAAHPTGCRLLGGDAYEADGDYISCTFWIEKTP